MSSASFSHQFYQRWALVPDPIRAAIVQELADIDALLQPETPPEQFVFSEPNFDTHLDTLYDAHSVDTPNDNSTQATAKQTGHAEQSESTEPNAEHSQQHSGTDSDSEMKNNQTDSPADKAELSDNNHKDSSNEITDISDRDVQKVDFENSTLANKNPETVKLAANHDEDSAQTDIDNLPNTTPSNERMPKTPKLIQDNEDLIHELGMHIDDYLSDQMTQLSEDLKSWLREEISRQLNDKV